MPNIQQYDAGNLGLRPTETGVESRAAAARRIGGTFNQVASATDTLARETERLGGQTRAYGREVEEFGGRQGAALADEGRHIASVVEAAGDQAIKYLDNKQISHGNATWATLLANKTKEWNEVVKNADPNDPTVAQQFMERLEGDLGKFREDGFYTEGGQKFADAHVNALRQHMAEKTQADMATLAGHAAVANTRQTVNELSSTVRTDPASLDFSLAALKSSTEGLIASSPNMTGTTAANVRSEILQKGSESIVKSAAMGYIEKTGKVPDWATDKRYAPYINGEELKQFAQASRYYQRLGQSEDRAARVQRDYEAKVDFNSRVNELELSTMPKNAGDKPTLPQDYWSKLRDLGTHPGAALDPGRLKTMVENGERITERLNKPEPLGRLSHETTVGLLNRMRSTDETRLQSNEDIYKAYGDGKLNTADFNFLTKEFKEMRTPEGEALSRDRAQFFKQYAGAIAHLAIGPNGKPVAYDPQLGSPKLYEAEMAARRVEADLRKKGLDPHLAYDPTSDFFVGKPANIQKWRGSMQGDLSDRAAAPAAAKREDAMPAIPPADQRAPGLYETPKGKLRWTGTGWVQP